MKSDDNFLHEVASFTPYVKPEEYVPATVGESYVAGLGQFMSEEMSISSWKQVRMTKDRNAQLEQLVKEGKIPGHLYESAFVGDENSRIMDWDYLARQSKELGIEVETDIELLQNLREELKLRREYSEDVYSRSSTLGKVAYFSGQMHAASIDPINVATMFAVPTKAWQAMSWGKRLVVAGGINIAAESAIQPMVMDWKRTIESPYTTSDMLMNIGIAGVAGVGLEGVVQVGGRTLRKIKAEDAISEIQRARKALSNQGDPDLDAMANTLKYSEGEIENLKVNAKGEIGDDITEGATLLEDMERTLVEEKTLTGVSAMEGAKLSPEQEEAVFRLRNSMDLNDYEMKSIIAQDKLAAAKETAPEGVELPEFRRDQDLTKYIEQLETIAPKVKSKAKLPKKFQPKVKKEVVTKALDSDEFLGQSIDVELNMLRKHIDVDPDLAIPSGKLDPKGEPEMVSIQQVLQDLDAEEARLNTFMDCLNG